MYFWNIDKLAEDLRADKVSESEQTNYLIALQVVGVIAILGHNSSSGSSIPIIFEGVVTLVAIYIISQLNKAGDNKNFVQRFIALSLPLTIRIGLMVFVLNLLAHFMTFAGFVSLYLGNDNDFVTPLMVIAASQMILYVAVFALVIVYHIWMYRKIKFISQK